MPASTLAPWNAAIRAAVAAHGGGRTHYLDPIPCRLNGESGKDYKTNYMDGLHPNVAGRALIARRLREAMIPAGTGGPPKGK